MHDKALSEADLDRFRAILVEERARVVSEIEYTEEEIAALQEQTGAERQDEGMGGSASFTLDREVGRALDDNAERILKAIDEALARIEAGTYGICTNCGERIPEGRLEARPYADVCIDCAR